MTTDPRASSAAPTLAPCPTHAVCPPCREGWGHWDGHKYVPTIQSAEALIPVSHECYGNRHDDCAWPRCECGCHRDR